MRAYIFNPNLEVGESPTPVFAVDSRLPTESIPALTLVSNFGKSMSMGQISLHAPHSDEA